MVMDALRQPTGLADTAASLLALLCACSRLGGVMAMASEVAWPSRRLRPGNRSSLVLFRPPRVQQLTRCRSIARLKASELPNHNSNAMSEDARRNRDARFPPDGARSAWPTRRPRHFARPRDTSAAAVSDKAGAVRSTPHRNSGKRVERCIAASSVRAIRVLRISSGGACRGGRRGHQVLLAARAAEYERQERSRRAEPDPDWPTMAAALVCRRRPGAMAIASATRTSDPNDPKRSGS